MQHERIDNPRQRVQRFAQAVATGHKQSPRAVHLKTAALDVATTMRMAKRLVCLPLGASPLLLSMYHKPGSTRFAVTEGLDAARPTPSGRASTGAAWSGTSPAPS